MSDILILKVLAVLMSLPPFEGVEIFDKASKKDACL